MDDEVIRAKLNLLGIQVMKARRTGHLYLMKGAHCLCHRGAKPEWCRPVMRKKLLTLWNILQAKDNSKYMWRV